MNFLFTCCSDFKDFKSTLTFLVNKIASLMTSVVFPCAGAAALHKDVK